MEKLSSGPGNPAAIPGPPNTAPPDTGPPNTAPPAAGRDRTTRQAAWWATAVAVPLTVLVAVVAIVTLSPDTPTVAPAPSATAARPQSTAAVPLPAPPLADRAATVCRALVSQLPAALRDLPQRPVTAGPEQNAAYGDPAITVACGGPAASFPPTDVLFVVNGACWHPSDQSDVPDGSGAAPAPTPDPSQPVVLTTVDREVPVRVTVPRAYSQPLQWVTPLSESVVASVPSAKTAPSGCTG